MEYIFFIPYFISWSMFVSCTYTMMYCICHLLQIYIFEIYTLTKNCTVLYALQVAHIIIPKTILNFTSVISHEMSQYDIC